MQMLVSKTSVGIQTNSVDLDQTFPRGAVQSGFTVSYREI